ncbi:helix-turn-helix domain-containing protein [Amycolatopsis sp. NPDC051045]|uniref:nSTAND1 domain-containing NTPase n=1 Tax=Amycolatopsis sp. NPDC051045 TaxID=3156922 RepID=UPI00341FF95F
MPVSEWNTGTRNTPTSFDDRDAEGGEGRGMTTPEQFAARLARLRSVSGKSYRRLGAETGLGYATVAGYCTGRHLPQLAVTAQFTRLLTALGVPQGEEQEEWLRLLRELRSETRSLQTGDVNPYPGLRGFEAADAGYFHGREDVVARIVTMLEGDGRSAVIVVGASGTGKSSLLRAGLVPVFRESTVCRREDRPWRDGRPRRPASLLTQSSSWTSSKSCSP